MTEKRITDKQTKMECQEKMRALVKEVATLTNNIVTENYKMGKEAAVRDYKVLKRFWTECAICYRWTGMKPATEEEKKEQEVNLLPFIIRRELEDIETGEMLALSQSDLTWLILSPSMIAWLMLSKKQNIVHDAGLAEAVTAESTLIGGTCSNVLLSAFHDLRMKKRLDWKALYRYNWACEMLQHNLVYSFIWEDRFDITLERESRTRCEIRSTAEERVLGMQNLARTLSIWKESGIKDYLVGYISESFKKIKELIPDWRATLLTYCEIFM